MVPFSKNEGFIGESHIRSCIEADEKRRAEVGGCAISSHLRLALCSLGDMGYF